MRRGRTRVVARDFYAHSPARGTDCRRRDAGRPRPEESLPLRGGSAHGRGPRRGRARGRDQPGPRGVPPGQARRRGTPGKLLPPPDQAPRPRRRPARETVSPVFPAVHRLPAAAQLRTVRPGACRRPGRRRRGQARGRQARRATTRQESGGRGAPPRGRRTRPPAVAPRRQDAARRAGLRPPDWPRRRDPPRQLSLRGRRPRPEGGGVRDDAGSGGGDRGGNGATRGRGVRCTAERQLLRRPAGGKGRPLALRVRRLRVLPAPAVVFLGAVHLVRRGLEPPLHRRVGVGDPHRQLFLLLSAHPASRSRIWRAWWRAWETWNASHSSAVRSPRRGCLTNRSWRRAGSRSAATRAHRSSPARNRDSAAARSTRAAGRVPSGAVIPWGYHSNPKMNCLASHSIGVRRRRLIGGLPRRSTNLRPLHSIPSAKCSTIWAEVHFPAGARCQSASERPAKGPRTIWGRSRKPVTRRGTAGEPDRRPRGTGPADRGRGGAGAATRPDTAPTRSPAGLSPPPALPGGST